MKIFNRILLWISDLKVAIGLLIAIAFASALGTAIPQGEPIENYVKMYKENPLIGLINSDILIKLQLDHIYSSFWFLGLLVWLSIALIICSWKRQWPTLKAALRWADYKEPKQLRKLAISKSIPIQEPKDWLKNLAQLLREKGWTVQQNQGRIAARKGVIGRVGPPIVHIGLIVLMLGAAWGALGGQKIERFLVPEKSIELISREGIKQVTVKLKEFQIERDPAGRIEQFRSKLELIEPGNSKNQVKELSVNHPLRYKGLTIYQADWSLAAIILRIGDGPKIQLPLTQFPELGEQIWGIVLPTKEDGTEPVLITLSNENGPIKIFDANGNELSTFRPGGQSLEVQGIPLQVLEVLSASGLLIKHDPGIPLVYTGFAITLVGSGLSILATRQIWAISDTNQDYIHIGGLCNRDLPGLAEEIPMLIQTISNE